MFCLLPSIALSPSAHPPQGTQPTMDSRCYTEPASLTGLPVLATFLVPNPLSPNPKDLAASSGLFFALTTFVISRAGWGGS